MKAAGPAKYTVLGTAGGMEARCYISMVEYNHLANWSFEEGESGWTATALKPMDELFVEDKVADSLTGTKHYHFWSAGKDTVEFTLEQTVTGLKAGTYSFSASIMGGDGGETEIYAYVKRGGETVATAPLEITVYNEWHTASIGDISCSEGDALTVGIYVNCAGPNSWGKIDDAMLSSVKE